MKAKLAVVAVALMLASVGCKRVKTGAVEWFGKKYSCPEDRIEATARDDLKYGDLIEANATKPTPPDEVKKDPERLAKWQRDQREDSKAKAERLNELDVFEVKGCDHVAYLGCRHAEVEEGHDCSRVNCWEIPSTFVKK